MLSDAGLVLWLVRGLGTAMLHGAATAIFAMLSQTASRSASRSMRPGVSAGLVAAVAIHAAFNLLPVSPVATTAMLLIVLPLLVLWVFQRSEQATREWVGAGLDLDLMLHETFSSEALALHEVRHVPAGAPRRVSRATSSPTCCACCGSSWSCRSRQRRC